MFNNIRVTLTYNASFPSHAKLLKTVELFAPNLPTPVQHLQSEILHNAGVQVFVKRDDLIHPFVSGNKWRKLKYNLLDAQTQSYKTILTFGGAYSNHLYATAAAGAALELEVIGVIRGEVEATHLSATLQFCQTKGMQFHFVTRETYKRRNDDDYLQELKNSYPQAYFIPEGGSSTLALNGVAELVPETELQLGFKPDYYAVAAGTGGTAAGILSADRPVLAFSALKGGEFLKKDIGLLLPTDASSSRLQLFTDYHFGGYAKHQPDLLAFIQSFKKEQGIQLEQVYTGKLFYGLFDLIQKGYFKAGTNIVAVHTGGLQGCLPALLGRDGMWK
jgi:1-aminocyclopropane-1-carboxylate deaminase